MSYHGSKGERPRRGNAVLVSISKRNRLIDAAGEQGAARLPATRLSNGSSVDLGRCKSQTATATASFDDSTATLGLHAGAKPVVTGAL